MNKCPVCGEMLTDEMIHFNMCWECGEILDKSLLEDDAIEKNMLAEEEWQNKQLEKEQQSEKYVEELNKKYELIRKGFLLTTGYNFEGYSIERYDNIVHGGIVLGTGFLSDLSMQFNDFLGTGSNVVGNKLEQAKMLVEKQLIDKAIKRGSNALIGVDYDVNVIGNHMLMVSGNATAVKIVSIKE